MATKQEMLFSVLAVKKGYMTPNQVQECMDIQRLYQEKKGQDVQLLAIFLQKGYLTKEQIVDLRSAPPSLPKTVTLEEAQQIEGFDVIERIGEGGVATVFKAVDLETDEEVALKVLFPIHAVNAVFVQRFLDEGEFLRRLDHPNIVKGYRTGVWPNEDVPPEKRLYYMSMELVRGMSVQDELNERGQLEESKALHIIVQIAEALQYLHANNCVHRDIKPDNILYSHDEGVIKLCDLGFAKEIEAASEGETEDVTCGTVQYISPEQARGLKDVDIRADIYSLGATLYHLVIGEVPFSGKDSMEVMAAQVLQSLQSDKYRKQGLSAFTGYFIEKMMAKEREVRYQTPKEAIDDIQSIMRGAADLIYKPEEDPLLARYGGGGNSTTRGESGLGPRRTKTAGFVPPAGMAKRPLTPPNKAPGGANGSAPPPPGRRTQKLSLKNRRPRR